MSSLIQVCTSNLYKGHAIGSVSWRRIKAKITLCVVNKRNYDRRVGPLSQTEGKIECGGKNHRKDRHISPSVVIDVTLHGKLHVLNISTSDGIEFLAPNVIRKTIRSD